MENLPIFVSVLFVLTILLALYCFYLAAGRSRTTLLVLTGWLGLQAVLGLSGFYKATHAVPPRFPIMIVLPTIAIVILFATRKGRAYIDKLDTTWLTLLHTLRIPIEIFLFYLSIYQLVPELMTFEGRNFDIISGVTAPFIVWFGYRKPRLGRGTLIAWNLMCIALLANVVTHGILSAPSPFQQLSLDQPNIGILYFPFVWLASFMVPLVLFSHLVSLRQLAWQTASRTNHRLARS